MNARVAMAAFALALTACARPPAPATAPVPVAVVVPAADTARADTAGRPAPGSATGRDTTGLSSSDVNRQAVAVFGDTLGADSTRADADEEPTFDMDVRSYETQERVQHFVDYFTNQAKEHIQRRLEIGSRYEPMIRAKFRAGGIPEDMSYLALIESGYDPNAYSRAAAVGMWQFMSSTGRDLGLRVDWWIDERRDPAKSTDAAVRFIKDLREQFGSLYLAAAAYNGGPGRIARGLSRYADDMSDVSGEDRFFALSEEDYLPRETRDYVPQLIAAALVGKEPARYGLSVREQPPYAYDSVQVGPAVPLAAIARASGSTVAEIRELNPFVLRGTTPPRGSLWARVPVGRAEGFDSAFAALPESERRSFTRVESKKGDTMARIAVKHDLSERELEWYNPKVERSRKTGRLVPGQVILVPTRAVASAARDVPDPSVERYGGSGSGRVITHVVKRGESLGLIARKYHTTVASLRQLNGLKKSVILPGQSIIVKGPARRARSAHYAAASSSKGARNGTTKASKRRSSTESPLAATALPSARSKTAAKGKAATKQGTTQGAKPKARKQKHGAK